MLLLNVGQHHATAVTDDLCRGINDKGIGSVLESFLHMRPECFLVFIRKSDIALGDGNGVHGRAVQQYRPLPGLGVEDPHGDILTEFEGRGDEVHVLPLSFSEYYAFKGGDKSEAFDDYSIYGGLPAVALMATEEQKSNYLISQMQNLYLRDIKHRYGLQDEVTIGEVLDVVASNISALTNPRNIANTMLRINCFAAVLNIFLRQFIRENVIP